MVVKFIAMKKNYPFLTIFKVNKPIIGMLHLLPLAGEPEFSGVKPILHRAKQDLKTLQNGGVDGVLVENWFSDSPGPFVSRQTAVSFSEVLHQLRPLIKVPFGINVLHNDYRIALNLALSYHASFIQLDVFIDKVKSNFSFSPTTVQKPFIVDSPAKYIHRFAATIGASRLPIVAFIQPKHYLLLERNKSIDLSALQAKNQGASALVVTLKTGEAPTVIKINKVKSAVGKLPVGIGSGFSPENAKEYLTAIDFAIVGTALKGEGKIENPVELARVKNLMQQVNKNR